jgi:type IV secretion system protein VirD4
MHAAIIILRILFDIARILLATEFGHIIDGLMVVAFLWWAFRPQRRLPGNRVRYQRMRLHLRLHPGRGFATVFELWCHWGRFATYRKSKRARPDLSMWQRIRHPHWHSVLLGTAHYLHRVRILLELHVLIMSPPRMGKTAMLCRWILRFPGPVISTTVKEDIYRYTVWLRKLFGQIHVFNPQGIGGIRSTFAINPVAGCANPAVAVRRATALCMATTTEKMQDGDWFKDKAAQLLAALLMVADWLGLDFRHISRWVFVDATQAQQELAEREMAEMAHTLDELHNSPAEKTSATFKMILSQCLGFMMDDQLAKCVLAPKGTGFDIPAFIRSRDTLYMIADSDSDQSPLAPLFAMILDEIKHEATQIGQRNKGGRLLRPLGMFLDEVTQICPIPWDKWAASVGGLGIQIFGIVHGIAQLRKRWGKEGARIIMDTANVKIFLPGIDDDETLETVTKAIGDVSLKQKGQEHTSEHRIISPAMLRALPDWHGLVVRQNKAPVIIRTPKVWNALRLAKLLGRDVTPPEVTGIPVEVPLSERVKDLELAASANGHHTNGHHPEGI